MGLLLAGFVVLVGSSSGRAAAGATWYVAATGADTNSCAAPASPCATLNGAVGRAADGDTIEVATDTYTGTGGEVVLVDKKVTLTGGWNASFTTQGGVSTIDGQGARRGVQVSGAVVTLQRFTIQNGNAGVSAEGAGIAVGGPGGASLGVGLVLDQSTVRNSGPTGGIWSDGGPLTITNSTVSGNSSNDSGTGGGITAATGAPLTIRNSTISGNSANSGGGGILVARLAGADVAQLSNVTITGNTASGGTGGGIAAEFGATVQMRNSIVAGNNGPMPGWVDVYPAGGVNSLGYNIGTGFSPAPGDLISNPVLGPLADNGGPTQTQTLLAGSPAVDAGNPGGCRDDTGALLQTDQRGLPRPAGSACDIGAVETQPPANDAFSSAVSLNTAAAPLAGSNSSASKEAGEPDHGVDAGGSSIWYSWAPAFSGPAFVSTAGSDFDTTLGIYTGNSVSALTTVAENDDSDQTGTTSQACFQAVAGTTYRIAVDGFDGDQGNVTLTWGQYTANHPCEELPPLISGTLQVGQTLNAATGTWLGSPAAFDYAWGTCDQTGNNCSTLSGATSATMLLSSNLAGKELFVLVNAEDATDANLDVTAPSALTTPVAAASGGGGGGGGTTTTTTTPRTTTTTTTTTTPVSTTPTITTAPAPPAPPPRSTSSSYATLTITGLKPVRLNAKHSSITFTVTLSKATVLHLTLTTSNGKKLASWIRRENAGKHTVTLLLSPQARHRGHDQLRLTETGNPTAKRLGLTITA
jgi:hypothetical protein